MNKILIGVLIALVATIGAKGLYIKKLLDDRAELRQGREQLNQAIKAQEASYNDLKQIKDEEIKFLHRALQRNEVINDDYQKFALEQNESCLVGDMDGPQADTPKDRDLPTRCTNTGVSRNLAQWVCRHTNRDGERDCKSFPPGTPDKTVH